MKKVQKLRCLDIITLCLAVGLHCFSTIPSANAASNEESSSSSEEDQNSNTSSQNKLLILMLDGFRWDYYDKQKNELRGFSLFLQEGVRAQWVDPVFPSLSYPAWTTISTGVYPETHGIIGNYMFDLKNDEVFDLANETSTTRVHWWQNAEPIWTTATRYNKKAFLRFWSRCDVPFNEVQPEKCTGYREAKGVQAIRDTLNLAVEHLLKDFQLVMVYGEHLDNIGHEYGPDSEELRQAVRDVDDIIYDFLDKMTDTGLDEKVNVIIVSDHGMKWVGEGSGTMYVSIGDYIDKNNVYKVLDRGALVSIAPYKRSIDLVYEKLQGQEGFDTYKRDEIPEEFHYKKNRLVQEILLVAKPQYYLHGLHSSKQIPRDTPNTKVSGGTHGYANMTDMRTIFFAKGPDFKKGVVHPPIHLVDEYQIFAELLHIPPQPNNGTWSKVVGMLVNKAFTLSPSPCSLMILLSVPLILLVPMNPSN